ncbi:uncharacterized protein LOC128883555 isoform X2 [Hylaeus volcanicus]|uniref:uncharacterized protein LOC128883555 isoform X2 n=1 Tax=Hylaeus volcanicus TaxID=313075 RepID=UPI0023B869C0|nr:uncharacterized protein LOC128883555 isoform X2 [Hylaeus volcanicus]
MESTTDVMENLLAGDAHVSLNQCSIDDPHRPIELSPVPEQAPQNNEDLSSYSVPDLLASTNWKWKLFGLQQVKNILTGEVASEELDEKLLLEYGNHLPEWLVHCNGNVQRVALELCVHLFLKLSPLQMQKIWTESTLYNVLQDKFFSQSRLLDTLTEALSSIFEMIPENVFFEPFVKFLESAIDSKGFISLKGSQLKKYVGGLNSLSKLLHWFGFQSFCDSPILQLISTFTTAMDATLKKSAYNFLIEVFLWTKNDTLVTQYVSEKQKAEIGRRLTDLRNEKRLAPLRKSFSHKTPIETTMETNSSNQQSSRDFIYKEFSPKAIPVLPAENLFKHMTQEQFEKRVGNASKWKEKVEVFQDMIQICEKLRRVKPCDCGIMISVLLKTIQLDSNLAVTGAALKCCNALALCLQDSFAPYLRQVGSMALMKLKDRNRSITCNVVTLLQTLLLCGSFEPYLEEILRLTCDKQSHVRNLALQWLLYVMNHPSQKAAVIKTFQKIIQCGLDALDDATAEVRSRGAQLLFIAQKIDQVHGVSACIEGLSEKKAHGVREAIARITLEECLDTIFAPANAASITKLSKVEVSTNAKFLKRQPSRTTIMKTTKAKSDTLKKSEHLSGSDVLVPEVTLDGESAKKLLETFVQPEGLERMTEKFSSSFWKDRVEGFDKAWDLVKTTTWEDTEPFCVWIRTFGMKNFAETHMNVNKRALQFLSDMVDSLQLKLSQACIGMFLSGFIEKVSDGKLKAFVLQFVEKCVIIYSLACVLHCIMAPKMCQKVTSKVRTEVCSLAEQFWVRFGPAKTDCHSFVAYAVKTSADRSAAARAASQRFLFVLYKNDPSGVAKTLRQSVLGVALLNDFSNEPIQSIANKPGLSSVERKVASSKSGTTTEQVVQTASETNKTVSESLDFLKGYLSGSNLKKLHSTDWTCRKEVLSQLNCSLLQTSGLKFCEATLHEFFSLLKHRLKDESNRSVLKELLRCIELLGSNLPITEAKIFIRCILVDVFLKFADKSVLIRQSCTETVIAWLKVTGFLPWVFCLYTSKVLSGSGEEREPILSLLASLDDKMFANTCFSQHEHAFFLQSFVTCLVNLLLDKKKILRDNAEVFLYKIARCLQPNFLQKIFKSTCFSSQHHVKVVFQKCITLASSQQTSSEIFSAQEPLTFFSSCGYVFKWDSITSPSVLETLESFPKCAWSSFIPLEENASFMTLWSHAANEKLLNVILETSSSHSNILECFEFWKTFFQSTQAFSDFFVSELMSQRFAMLYVVQRWFVVRLSYPLVATEACHILSLLHDIVQCNVAKHKGSYEPVSYVMLCSTLPYLFQYGVQTESNQIHFCENVSLLIRKIVSWCSPQLTFQMLLYCLKSLNHKFFFLVLTELCAVCETSCEISWKSVEKAIPIVSNIAISSKDTCVEKTAQQFLQLVCSRADDHTISMLIPQFQVGENLSVFLSRTLCTNRPLEETLTFHEKNQSCVEANITQKTTENDFSKTESFHCSENEDPFLTTTGSCPSIKGSSQPDSNSLSLCDYLEEWNQSIEEKHIEDKIQNTQGCFAEYFADFEKREKESFQQDLLEECRRVMEGRLQPNASHIAYWNGVMRLDDTLESVQGETLILADLLRGMNRPDYLSIAQNAEELSNFFITPSNGTGQQKQWQVVFASEIITVLLFGLRFCFDIQHYETLQDEKEHAWIAGLKLTQLANRILRDKNVLQRVSLIQLRELYKVFILAMSVHSHWARYEQGAEIARRLNTIIARDLMSVVIPRNACHLFLMIFDFLLNHLHDLTPSLVIRVHRKLITKFNTKHSFNPPTAEEIPYYLRTLDAAILALKQLDASPLLGSIESTTERLVDSKIQQHFVFDQNHLQELKAQIELLIKEIIYICLVILGPHLVGVFLRDLGFHIPQDETLLNPSTATLPMTLTLRLNSRLSCRLEKLMNTPYSIELTATVCPNILTKQQDEGVTCKTYYDHHNQFFHQKTQTLLSTPPLCYPFFSINEFIAQAKPNVTLETLDPSLACGWSVKRNVTAGNDIQPLSELLPSWNESLVQVSSQTCYSLNTHLAKKEAMLWMSRNLMHNEIVGKYIRRALTLTACIRNESGNKKQDS